MTSLRDEYRNINDYPRREIEIYDLNEDEVPILIVDMLQSGILTRNAKFDFMEKFGMYYLTSERNLTDTSFYL